MFQKAGVVVDRYWPIGLTIIGTVALGVLPFLEGAMRAWPFANVLALVITSALLSGGSAIVAATRNEGERKRDREQVMTGIRGTLVPVAERFIKVASHMSDAEFATSMTELAARSTTFAKTKDDDLPDTNIYLFESPNKLVRVNDAAGDARARFTKTKRKDARSREEAAVVDRVTAKDKAVCADVRSPKNQKKLVLAPGERTYRAFISVPIVVNGTARGMISLNSKRTGRLTDVHEVFLEQMAQLVAAIDAVKRDEKRS